MVDYQKENSSKSRCFVCSTKGKIENSYKNLCTWHRILFVRSKRILALLRFWDSFYSRKKHRNGFFSWIFYFLLVCNRMKSIPNANKCKFNFDFSTLAVSQSNSVCMCLCILICVQINFHEEEHGFNKDEVVRNRNRKRIENWISVADNTRSAHHPTI